MNKKIRKILPYVCALFNIGSIVPHNNQMTFAASNEKKENKEKVKLLKEAMNCYKTNWLDKFTQKIKKEDASDAKMKYTIRVLNPTIDPYTVFESWAEPDKPNSGEKKSAERIAWEAVKKFAIEPHYGIISGTLGVTAITSDEDIEKCMRAIEVAIRTEVFNGRPLASAAYDILHDVLPAVVGYSALGAVAWKLYGSGEKIFDAYVDRKFENMFAGREQKKENERSLKSTEKLGWDFNSINCKELRQELLDELVPMYPYAKDAINEYITTLIGIIKQKQESKEGPTVIVNVHGDPGCGKSTLIKKTMQILAKYNAPNPNAQALFITPTDSKTTDKEVSAEDLCFGSYSRVVNGKRIKKDSTFAACLKHTDNFITILDDIDKQTTGVFKILWNIADGGKIDGFPTSKVMFMSTANSDLKLQSSKVDGSQSSEAMLSRVKNIHFPNPDSAAYQKSFISEVISISEEESCKIIVSNSVLKAIGDHCVKARKGMREKNALIIKLRGLLVKADAENWECAEIKFDNGELSLVEKKKNADTSGKSQETKNKDTYNEIKNVANIASLDMATNEKVVSNIDKLVKRLEKSGANVGKLVEKLKDANMDVDELVERINREKIEIDKLDIDELIKEINQLSESNKKGNFVDELKENLPETIRG